MDRILETIRDIKPIDTRLMEETQNRLDSLTKPRGSLGRLEDFAKRVVGITRKVNPKIDKKVIFTMAGDHGVSDEGVSAFPKEVTHQMVYNFLRGGAGINVLARHVGARVVVVDMGVAQDLEPHPGLLIKKVGYGTRNMAKGEAMSKEDAIQSIIRGIEVFEQEMEHEGIDIIALGDMGIANTTPSSAIVAVITDSRVEDVTSRGSGIGDEQLMKKILVIKRALEINRPDPKDPIDVLQKVGGYEIGGLVGCTLAAARNSVPVVIDGFITTAASLIATCLAPLVKDYLFASHNSAEIGHRVALHYMGLKPMFDFGLRLGEGTGAALGISIIEAGCKILTEMASFNEADVSRAN
ncbi:MAG: nicotinate-nucleotide--dimethylbenzimidazole phosphoribosyltransferase [bacterium]|nr:nicotinate-nucleotide--dimethylbenzimidazole phosphoribosyltransferase [bacterium]